MNTIAASLLAFDLRNANYGSAPSLADLVVRNHGDPRSMARLLEDDTSGEAWTVYAPKFDGGKRRFDILHPKDVFRYCQLAFNLLPTARVALSKVDSISYAYRLRATNAQIAKQGLFRTDGWNELQAFQRNRHDQGETYVGVSDISQFYYSIQAGHIEKGLDRIGVPPRFIDQALRLFDEFGVPIGYSTSHLLARILLIPVDQSIIAYGTNARHFSDDVRVTGKTADIVGRKLSEITEFIEAAGFRTSERKTAVRRPPDSYWCGIIGDPGEIPVAQYVVDEGVDYVELDAHCSYPLQSTRTFSFSAERKLDWHRLWFDHFDLGQRPLSEHFQRKAIKEIGRLTPNLIEDQLILFIEEHPYATRYYLPAVSHSTSSHVLLELCSKWETLPYWRESVIVEFIRHLRKVAHDNKDFATSISILLRTKELPPALQLECRETVAICGNLYHFKQVILNASDTERVDLKAATIAAIQNLPGRERNQYYDELSKRSFSQAIAVRYTKDKGN